MCGGDLRASAPIRSPAGHAWPFEATERRLEPLLDRIPITRVYDATPLDRLGVPVWAAVTPLARDLTVHAGKGQTPQAARISAVMEAFERVCAEQIDPARIRRSSRRALSAATHESVLDPGTFDLPFDTAYAPECSCAWVRGHDLLAREPAWVAADLVVSPARDGIARGPETNGLAAGNEPVEAVLHAILEVIERDAAARRAFLRRHGRHGHHARLRLLEPDGLPPAAAHAVDTMRAADLTVQLEDLTHDVGVPVIRAVLLDRGFPGREGRPTAFEGLGADLDAGHAAARALLEAAQAHTAVLVGARDSFEGAAAAPVSRRQLLEGLGASSTVATLGDLTPGTAPPEDLGARLTAVLDRLRAVGFAHCVVVDLAREDLGVPVVRVLVPGAAGPYGETARRPALRLLRELV